MGPPPSVRSCVTSRRSWRTSRSTSTSVRTCTPTSSCRAAPPCTPASPTASPRRSPPRAGLHEDQDHRAPGAQVLSVDRRLHPLVALHLPADVDLQAGVRRVGPLDRAPQVLLDTCCVLPRWSSAGRACLFTVIVLSISLQIILRLDF